jgi:hypothetical protein
MHSSTILVALLTLGYSVALPVSPYLVRRGPRQTGNPMMLANDVVRLAKREPKATEEPARPSTAGPASTSILKDYPRYQPGGASTPAKGSSSQKVEFEKDVHALSDEGLYNMIDIDGVKKRVSRTCKPKKPSTLFEHGCAAVLYLFFTPPDDLKAEQKKAKKAWKEELEKNGELENFKKKLRARRDARADNLNEFVSPDNRDKHFIRIYGWKP